MGINQDGPAPYAPPSAVLAVLDFDRKRGLPPPVTADTIERVGVSAALAPRTIQALRLLDLIADDGMPTQAMLGLRKASSTDYPKRLTEVLQTVYAEVFKFVDPREDGQERVRDAFRRFTPIGMQERMATLFLGLCAAAEIIDEAPRGRGRPPKIQGQAKPQKQRTPKSYTSPKVDPPEIPEQPLRNGQPAFVTMLLDALPEPGSVWTLDERQKWTSAALAAFDLNYKVPAKDSG
jgi:hypothetical protein